ncbi:MAG TPA: hypothetical protein VNC40_15255 [Gaiellaceae bacterium]|nr:hypothetical protein [Gaiellaceae bacterium]
MDSARRRVRIARYVIGAVAAGAFAATAVVVRTAHPGTHGRAASAQASIPAPSSAFQQAAAQSGVFGSGGGSVSSAPASSSPVVQSSGS